MEKQTKILLGVGAVIAAYLILKPKGNVPLIPLKVYDTDILNAETSTNKVGTQPLFICREGVEIKAKDVFGKGEQKACQIERGDIIPILRNPNYDGYNANKQTIIGDTTIPNDIPSSIDTTGLIYGAIPKDLDVLLVQNNAGIYIQGIYDAEKEREYCIDDLALRSADGIKRTCWQGYKKYKSTPNIRTIEFGNLMQPFITKIVGVYGNYQVAPWNFNYDTNLWEKANGVNTIESNNNEQLNNEIKQIEDIYFKKYK
jgi:hypothetical protein